MKKFIIPFAAYLLLMPLFELLGFNYYLAYFLRGTIVLALVAYFWKAYKLKFKLITLDVLFGIFIFLLWLLLENLYTVFSSTSYNPNIVAGGYFPIILMKLISMSIIAPVIEELFTRSFLMRFLINANKWQKVKIGSFTWFSFIGTVLFFGFAHNRWLQGIITGVLLNVLIYKTKRVESCIIAHAIANILLAAYVIATNSWFLW